MVMITEKDEEERGEGDDDDEMKIVVVHGDVKDDKAKSGGDHGGDGK